MMQNLLLIIKTICHIALGTLLIFGVFLLVDAKQGLLLASFLLMGSILLGLLGIQGLLAGQVPRFHIYSRKDAARFLFLVIFFTLSAVFFSITNNILHKALTHELTPQLKSQYYYEAIHYEKDFFLERIAFLKSLDSKVGSEVTVYYDGADLEYAIETVRHIRKVRFSNEKLIESHEPSHVKVILYRNPLIFQKHVPFHLYEHLNALYVPSDATIHLLLTQQMEGEMKRFLRLLGHEYTHHWIISYLDSKGMDNRHLPRWFEEGIAEYAGFVNVRQIPRFAPINLVPFTRLDTVQDWAYENRRSSPHKPYKQSYYAIDQIIRDGNKKKLKKLLLNQKQNFYRYFEQEMGEPLLAFEVRFLRDELKSYKEERK
jgi:hypothetical protein